jgi:hypothetical protein
MLALIGLDAATDSAIPTYIPQFPASSLFSLSAGRQIEVHVVYPKCQALHYCEIEIGETFGSQSLNENRYSVIGGDPVSWQ